MRRVDVLLATYNGERYLREQIDSVLAQQDVDVSLFVRDDGSSDKTLELLAEYVDRFPARVHVVPSGGKGVGAAFNFLSLVGLSSSADYFALCDQDDVWPPDRLITALNALEQSAARVRLYCSAVLYVDAGLNPLGASSRRVSPSFANALVENIAQGCTMVGDAALRDLVRERQPAIVAMHDWWLYLLASAFGVVIYDPHPRLLYRQHSTNAVGGNFSIWRRLEKNWRRYVSGAGWPMAAQAEQLLALYSDSLTQHQKLTLRAFIVGKASLRARFRLVADWRLRRQSLFETLVVKLLILVNAY